MVPLISGSGPGGAEEAKIASRMRHKNKDIPSDMELPFPGNAGWLNLELFFLAMPLNDGSQPGHHTHRLSLESLIFASVEIIGYLDALKCLNETTLYGIVYL